MKYFFEGVEYSTDMNHGILPHSATINRSLYSFKKCPQLAHYYNSMEPKGGKPYSHHIGGTNAIWIHPSHWNEFSRSENEFKEALTEEELQTALDMFHKSYTWGYVNLEKWYIRRNLNANDVFCFVQNNTRNFQDPPGRMWFPEISRNSVISPFVLFCSHLHIEGKLSGAIFRAWQIIIEHHQKFEPLFEELTKNGVKKLSSPPNDKNFSAREVAVAFYLAGHPITRDNYQETLKYTKGKSNKILQYAGARLEYYTTLSEHRTTNTKKGKSLSNIRRILKQIGTEESLSYIENHIERFKNEFYKKYNLRCKW